MAYFTFIIDNISRCKKGTKTSRSPKSFARALAYINGQNVYDSYLGKHFNAHSRDDLICKGVLLPENAPERFVNLQTLANELNAAEKRKDARTAQRIIMSLPNALPKKEYQALVERFCLENFVKHGRCACYAIHSGEKNDSLEMDMLPSIEERANNPHAHIIIPFRAINENGFYKTKIESRVSSTKEAILAFRKSWAEIQNEAFERAGIDTRVTHLSLKVQGINKIPRKYISRKAYELERQGIPTDSGQEYIKSMLLNQLDEDTRSKLLKILNKRAKVRELLAKELIENAKTHQTQMQLAKERCKNEHIASRDFTRENSLEYEFER